MCGKMKRFFVAGSTHQGEEEVVIQVYQELIKKYPDFKLIIVPRHIERTKDVSVFCINIILMILLLLQK